MKRRKIFTKDEALMELKAIAKLYQKRKAVDSEIEKRLQILEKNIRNSAKHGFSSNGKPEKYLHLSPSSSIAVVAAAFIQYCKTDTNLKAGTINNYCSHLFSIEKLAGRRIGITKEEFLRIFDETTLGINANTRNNKLSAFRNLIGWSLEKEIINVDPHI